MIHQKDFKQHNKLRPSWKDSLLNGFSNWKDLALYLSLDIYDDNILHDHKFTMRVPVSFAKRIKKGDINDPLLRQVMPLQDELNKSDGFSADPLSENDFSVIPGLLHKYKNRVLLILHSACAVHCRYCFRREFDYAANKPSQHNFKNMIKYIKQNKQIDEVILSGGDPLMHNDKTLSSYIHALNEINHIKRLRIHSRIPVVLPERIDSSFLKTMSESKLQKIMVIHMNHANEMSEDVACALKSLREHGFTILNQSTLLKGVNDNATTLKELSEVLFSHAVIPYYLHVLDKVNGAAHFEISDAQAISIHQELKNTTSGYLVPKLVRELAHKPAKTWLYNE